MSLPESFSSTEREYYASVKELVRDHLPSGRQFFTNLHTAYERFFETEGILLSRRERSRLYLFIMEEVRAELEGELEDFRRRNM